MDREYKSNLAGFIDKRIKAWAANKKKHLELKFKRNFEAVTNADFRSKKWKSTEATKDWHSTAWVGFVRVKVWSFLSVMMDTALKGGKIPFVLDPSPYDEKYMTPQMLQERDQRLKKMTSKIEQQLVLRNADREYIKKWSSLGYYGMAFSAFDIQDVESVEFKIMMDPRAMQAVQNGLISQQEAAQYQRYELVKDSEAVPGHRYVSVWDMVWDMDADGLQDGEGYAERKKSCPYDLRQLNGVGYIPDAIEQVIKDNQFSKDSSDPTELQEHPGKAALNERKKSIDRYCFYMRVPRKYADEFERDLVSGGGNVVSISHMDYQEAEETGDDVEVMGEIANQEIIRYIVNETGKRPHKLCTMEQNLDEATGVGISDNMESVQESLIGMIRAFEDNKKLSGNVITAVKKRYFNNPKQAESVFPGAQFEIADACPDVRQAIIPILIPDTGETLMSGIQLMMQLKDDVSMIPTILQGFNLPKHAPDTAYEMQQLTINAGKYIGHVIRNNDEMFIEPEIKDIYEYNMIYGDDESCKVNGKVKANGFTSFMNKEIRGTRMQQVLGLMTANEILAPYVEVEPHLEIIYEAMDENPERFIKSAEKRAQEAQQRAQMEATAQQQAIQAAQIEAQIETQKEVAVKGAEHQFEMEAEDQKHEHRLIEDGIKAKAAEKQESQRGPQNGN